MPPKKKSKVKPVKAIRAWAVERNGQIVPTVRLRLFALRIEAVEFVEAYYRGETTNIVAVLISPFTQITKNV